MPLKGTGNHFWSISVEEQFYLAAPLVIILMGFGRRPLFWIIAVVLLCATHVDFASISFGVFAAVMKREYGDWHLRARAIVVLGAVAILSFLALTNVTYYPFAAPIFAIAIVLLAARPGHRGPLGTFAGGVSYPMYLNHWMGAFLAHGIAKRVDFLPPLAEGLLAYAGGVMAGVAAYLLVDRLVMARRNAYYSPVLGRSLGIAAYLLVGCGIAVGIVRWGLN